MCQRISVGDYGKIQFNLASERKREKTRRNKREKVVELNSSEKRSFLQFFAFIIFLDIFFDWIFCLLVSLL